MLGNCQGLVFSFEGLEKFWCFRINSFVRDGFNLSKFTGYLMNVVVIENIIIIIINR